MGLGECATRPLRCRWKHYQGRISSFAHDRALERNTVPAGQRERASGIPELAGIAGIPAFQCGFSRDAAGAVSHSSAVSAGLAVDVSGRGVYCRAAWNWLFTSRCSIECCRGSDPGILE